MQHLQDKMSKDIHQKASDEYKFRTESLQTKIRQSLKRIKQNYSKNNGAKIPETQIHQAEMKSLKSNLNRLNSKPSNYVMIDEEKKTIYLPGYLRIKVKNFTEMSLENLDAQINATLIFNLYYGNILKYFEGERFSQNKKTHYKKSLSLTENKEADDFIKQKANQNLEKQVVPMVNSDHPLKKSQTIEEQDKFTYNQRKILYSLMNKIIFNFTRDDALLVSQGKQLETKMKHQEQQKSLKFTIRKLLRVFLEGKLFWSPIQTIYSILQITVQSIQFPIFLKGGKQQKWQIKINLMNHEDMVSKFSFEPIIEFGHYCLEKTQIAAFYSNKRISQADEFKMHYKKRKELLKNKQKQQQKIEGDQERLPLSNEHSASQNSKSLLEMQEQQICSKKQQLVKNINQHLNNQKSPLDKKCKQWYREIQGFGVKSREKGSEKKQAKIEYFQHAHFNIPLFRYPMQSVLTVFAPLFLLAIINLSIFFQSQGLGDRIGSIATLMIAFVAFIPTIRQQIPPNPSVILVQILVYIQTGTSLLALIHSLRIRNFEQFELDLQHKFSDSLKFNMEFTLSLIASIVCFLIVVGMVIYHYTLRFSKSLKDSKKKWESNKNPLQAVQKKQNNFDRNKWRNEQCDEYFKKGFMPLLDETLSSIDGKDLHLVYRKGTSSDFMQSELACSKQKIFNIQSILSSGDQKISLQKARNNQSSSNNLESPEKMRKTASNTTFLN